MIETVDDFSRWSRTPEISLELTRLSGSPIFIQLLYFLRHTARATSTFSKQPEFTSDFKLGYLTGQSELLDLLDYLISNKHKIEEDTSYVEVQSIYPENA